MHLHNNRLSLKHAFRLEGRSMLTAASQPAFSVLAWGKGELSPCRRLLGVDKRFRVFLPAFVSTALYQGITPGSRSITPLQSGSPQWVACSPFRTVTEERQCNTPVGSTESFLCCIVSSARWDWDCCSPLWILSCIAQKRRDCKTRASHSLTYWMQSCKMEVLLLQWRFVFTYIQNIIILTEEVHSSGMLSVSDDDQAMACKTTFD